MKEFDGHLNLTPDTQLIAEINKEYTLKGRLRKRRGLILFAVNTDTWTAKPVNITTNAVMNTQTGRVETENKAVFDPNVIYEWAINAERAVYKVKRDLVRYIMAQEQKQLIKR